MTDQAQPVPETGDGPVPKVDPETLVLRGRPTRVVRFKRGAVISLAALMSVSIATTAWRALKPAPGPTVDLSQERGAPGKVATDALNGLPTSYDDAPKLGPPLPGDLGGPILEYHRKQLAIGGELPVVESAADQAAAAAREAQISELKAARESPLLVKSTTSSSDAGGLEDLPPVMPQFSADAGRPLLDPDRDPNAQGRKMDFANAHDSGDTANPHALVAPISPFTLSAGSVIAASLITGLRSELPGLVTAQVTEHVYDSVTGRILLIPQGARLIGRYDSVVAFGQRRALVVWQRIVLPDGSSLALDNVTATDPSGYAGLADKVDFHSWTLLKGVAVSTMLGVGSNLTFGNESDLVQAIRQSAQQNASRAGDQLTSRNLNVQPTITVRPGASVRLVVHKDLILAPWRGVGE
ncbi:TrbI/VirB10 family protein [Sphingomonas qomolangmaensis]|uniref:Conjugal transfer protein TrbI n=1 Tax=Sphingomonas qomolangmaensis TaxID=2918765 RepID=A0ABY5L630_9SPHN|nr:TrbI/VirB10 family protein [Sphingomonas qomolangmaensis]UUL82405.1 conjugal transfer protein TrbI [Sphingomonas qomolangmaensis]